jgi:hypothetical protein
MTIHADPSVDPTTDPRRAIFHQLCERKDIEGLRRLILQFIAEGHNPKDPTDSMFEILGITPEFLALTLFTLQHEAEDIQPVFTNAAEETPPLANSTPEPAPEPEIEKI